MSPVERIVVASSDKAYGDAQRLPYTEETSLEARYPYDTSKLCTDVIAIVINRNASVPGPEPRAS